MPKIKENSSRSRTDPGETKYKTEVLLKSRALSGYQTDFARALLTQKEYSINEARAVLDTFYGKEGKSNGRRNLDKPE